METVATQYGQLHDLTFAEYYQDGALKACILNNPNRLVTPWGILTPQYEESGFRRKYGSSIRFYRNGVMQRIALHQQTLIHTPAGLFPAELLTFYESGHLKRLFPLNGKLSAFWSEENEYELAQDFDFQFSFGSFKKKIITIRFYENGLVQGVTFWPQDFPVLQTPVGEAETRIGITLFESGRLRSFEPCKPLTVHTPIGDFKAFNPTASGIHGDTNSLVFHEDGSIHSLATSSDMVTVTGNNGEKTVFAPMVKPGGPGEVAICLNPLWIKFDEGRVGLAIGSERKSNYSIDQCTFSVSHLPPIIIGGCNAYPECQACGLC